MSPYYPCNVQLEGEGKLSASVWSISDMSNLLVQAFMQLKKSHKQIPQSSAPLSSHKVTNRASETAWKETLALLTSAIKIIMVKAANLPHTSHIFYAFFPFMPLFFMRFWQTELQNVCLVSITASQQDKPVSEHSNESLSTVNSRTKQRGQRAFCTCAVWALRSGDL